MPNGVGQAYAFMTLTAIASGRSAPLRTYLESLPVGSDSPFARLEQTHFARCVLIPQLIDLGPPPEEADTLKNEYLLFSADFDGPLLRFLDALCDAMPVETDAIWGHCVGYPGIADPAEFARYMRHNQIDTTFPFAAYPDASVAEVREALQLRSQLIDFAIRAQAMDPARLRETYRQEFAS
ncbi:MAG: hypothetical protein AABM30_11555 [Actinomycetota bacterium]